MAALKEFYLDFEKPGVWANRELFGDRFQYAFFSKSHLRTSTIQFYTETSMILIVLPSLPPKKCSFRAVKENLSFCRQLPVMPLISHKNYFQC